MNRRFNTVLFLIGATVLNLLLLFFYFLAFSGLAALFVPDRTGWWAVSLWIVIFVCSLASGWFTYRWAFGILKERVPLDRWFDSTLFKGMF